MTTVRLRTRVLSAVALALIGASIWGCGQSVRPEPDEPLEGPLREWYYTGARIQNEAGDGDGAWPGLWSPAREWLVALNMGDEPTVLEVTYYFEDHPPSVGSWRIGRQASSAIPLHEHIESPVEPVRFGVRVRSREPIVLQPTRGESPPGEDVTGAMTSFMAYPGPLGRKETRWAYADGLILASESPLEEREWITILNPNANSDTDVELTFLVNGQRLTEQVKVPSERVRIVDLFNTGVFPRNRNTGVIVESGTPVLVGQTRRAYRKGSPVTASMWSCFAHPVGDLDVR